MSPQTAPEGLPISIGLDIGSTTIKAVAIQEDGTPVLTCYERHNARIRGCVMDLLRHMLTRLGDRQARLTMTGSIGLGIAERCGFAFIQEVVAATIYVGKRHPQVKTMIDIGGEDAKVVFFQDGKATDLRMNGNCAGGTGAFIDQMAILLGLTNEELNQRALEATQVYAIASRCGVFCKTDVQNLIAKNAATTDIAKSIFHAVAVQTAVTLSHGCDMESPILLCGGPLTFLPALRKAFMEYLKMGEQDFILPEQGHLVPAWGAAIHGWEQLEGEKRPSVPISQWIEQVEKSPQSVYSGSGNLKPLFKSEGELLSWQQSKQQARLLTTPLPHSKAAAWLGIDSGSTTTKIVLIDSDKRALFTYYCHNNGNPIQAVTDGLLQLQAACAESGTELTICGACSTGYGEDLIKAAFGLDNGIIETIAHYLAARHLTQDVSFILDIGGQDMKAIFINDGIIHHIEINEACSSGCGTFIETFAKSMGYSVEQFAHAACHASLPSDLGTRCTVFMNSKVKQVLREGATVADIAAGLSYSVINNCLYKVLKIKNTQELGGSIVVQGGTMKNDAVCRALEQLTGRTVLRSDRPELMGAYGAALHAHQYTRQNGGRPLEHLLKSARYDISTLQCKGCENQCLVSRYTFEGGTTYFSGNKCERIFNNRGSQARKGRNLYEEKNRLLWQRAAEDSPSAGGLRIGIPRVLGMWEEFPFWHSLLKEAGLHPILSDASNYALYERGVRNVMSDNICFPAKLVHGHILNLLDKGVDRIFMPYVIFEPQDMGQNSFNCPIVSGYSDVIRNTMQIGIPLDAPAISFKEVKVLWKQCRQYLNELGIGTVRARHAFDKALQAQQEFETTLHRLNQATYAENRRNGRLTIVLAGRPYHADPLVQHKIADMVSAMDVDVLTEDIVRGESLPLDDVHFVSQWAYPEHILKAAQWAARQDANVQFMELTSFGCGPDSFMLDEIHQLLQRHGKALTQLKIDDVSNIGSLKLRVRSVVDSMRMQLAQKSTTGTPPREFRTTPAFTEEERLRRKKILVPYFTQFITPLIPSFMQLAGYDVDELPMSDPVSDEKGLRYANNEICYPATLIVGDIIKAFDSHAYRPEDTAVAITQTGGQCRATNYISLIKKALVDAGYDNVPVVSLSFSGGLGTEQPGFRFEWKKLVNIALSALLYSDAIAKMYYAAVPREKTQGSAARLRDKFLDIVTSSISRNQSRELKSYLTIAAKEFNDICTDRACPRVGIVGEIFLKFNPYAQRHLTQWLIDHHLEVEPPMLTQFFLQSFVNLDVNARTGVEATVVPAAVRRALHWLVRRRMQKYNRICAANFRYFHPFEDVYDLARSARDIVSLNAQFGEGWLLPGEVALMARQGIRHVVSLQPFGCIANHIISKGIEKRIRQLYPDMNFLTLDFDSGVSNVNVTNRLLLFANELLKAGH